MLDVYVDGVLVDQNKEIKKAKKELNSILYTYIDKTGGTIQQSKKHRIGIVVKGLKDTNKFYLNAVGIISGINESA